MQVLKRWLLQATISIERVKEINPNILTYDLRIPMLSEVDELVSCADISLNSSLEILKELNRGCFRAK